MKYTENEILNEFSLENPKKSVFGNYRIDGDTLLYRAQTSEDAPRWYDEKDFKTARATVGEKLKATDGKLTSEGKTVLFEALTAKTPNHGLKIQFYEADTIAHRVKNSDGTYSFIGNDSILPLIGRTVAYGNVNENTVQTEIQRAMVGRGFLMLPLNRMDDLDFSTFKKLDEGEESVFTTQQQLYRNYRYHTVDVKNTIRATVFEVEGHTYLYDYDRRESKYNKLHTFATRVNLKGLPKTVAGAYEALKPQDVRTSEALGQNVKRIGSYFFIPCAEPAFPKLSQDEIYEILSVDSYVDPEVIKYLTGKNYKSEKRAEKLISKVPRCLSLGGTSDRLTLFKGIIIDGATYAYGSAEMDGRAKLGLDQWHRVVKRVAL